MSPPAPRGPRRGGAREVDALIGLGRLERSAARLDEALALAHALEGTKRDTILAATIARARLPGGDVEAALAALAEHEERVAHRARLEARFRLWERTRDTAHLQHAHRLLAFLRDHAPADCRETMIENVPLHRDIAEAWNEHGGDA